MLEKMKEIPFIDESAAVKLTSNEDGSVSLERNDRVVWAKEICRFRQNPTGISCYVEASKFFALIDEIDTLEQTTCLIVKLKNRAKYELPFLDVSWEQPSDLPEIFDGQIDFDLSDLMISTLKNLVKPELQCILIDPAGAVSCDFVTACFSRKLRFPVRFLLPADLQPLVDGKHCSVSITDKIYIRANGIEIVTAAPTIEDMEMWETLRGMVAESPEATFDGSQLLESLKRLQLFGDYVSFDGERVKSGANFEPFPFPPFDDNAGGAAENLYEIEKLMKILSTAKAVSESHCNVVLSNDSSTFLVSPLEDA